jgi:ribosome-binding factor A
MIFAREVSDPRLEYLNVTRVEVSGDLRVAKIFVAPRGDADATREMMDALVHAAGYFRRRLAESLDLRFAPEVRFLVDPSIEKGERFLQVLEQVEAEERQRTGQTNKRTRKKN